jgi:hypothetical protein
MPHQKNFSISLAAFMLYINKYLLDLRLGSWILWYFYWVNIYISSSYFSARLRHTYEISCHYTLQKHTVLKSSMYS